jgi:membrane fusion protein (multidrug efflux system)
MENFAPCPASSFLVFCLGGLALCALGCEQSTAGGAHRPELPPLAVQTLTLKPERIPRLLTAVGALESPQTTWLSSDVEGIVTFLDIPEGQRVDKGRLLARVDDRRSRAMLSVAEARYRNARDTFERLEQLHGEKLISKQELDDATAELRQAAGALDDARTLVGQAEIRAPFTGQLGLKQISLGAYLAQGAPVVELTQTDPLRLVFGLPQREVDKLALGQSVRGVAGDCTQRFQGAVMIVDPKVDAATRSVQVQAEVANPDGILRPGMSARVAVEVGAVDDAVTVPQEAVVRRGTKTLVYTVKEDGTAAANEVTLGQYFVDRVEVASGLRPGDVVVAAGLQKLRGGAHVEQQPYERIANPNLELGFESIADSCEF